MAETAITVLLVDDHDLVRRGFRRLLEDDPGLLVVGEATDGQQAVSLALALKPRVVVMDFALPGMNGAVATKEILRTAPQTAVLMLSMHSEPTYVRTCLDAGARGYLLKNAMDLEMVQAVEEWRRASTCWIRVSETGIGGPGRNPTDDARTGSAAVDRARQIEQRDRRSCSG